MLVNKFWSKQNSLTRNSAFEDMKGNFYQVDIPYKLVLAIDDNQGYRTCLAYVAVYLRDVYLDSFSGNHCCHWYIEL